MHVFILYQSIPSLTIWSECTRGLLGLHSWRASRVHFFEQGLFITYIVFLLLSVQNNNFIHLITMAHIPKNRFWVYIEYTDYLDEIWISAGLCGGRIGESRPSSSPWSFRWSSLKFMHFVSSFFLSYMCVFSCFWVKTGCYWNCGLFPESSMLVGTTRLRYGTIPRFWNYLYRSRKPQQCEFRILNSVTLFCKTNKKKIETEIFTPELQRTAQYIPIWDFLQSEPWLVGIGGNVKIYNNRRCTESDRHGARRTRRPLYSAWRYSCH